VNIKIQHSLADIAGVWEMRGRTAVDQLPLSLATRQAMYVKRNIEAHSRNQSCSRKAVSIKYCECACLCLCLSYPTSKSHFLCFTLYCHLWPDWLHHMLPNLLINSTIFGKNFIEHKKCSDFLYSSVSKF